jgi:HEAT repeat protein
MAAGACLTGLGTAGALAQPAPTPPPVNQPPAGQPTTPPTNMQPPLGGAGPKDIAIPNAPSYPTQIDGRTLEEWIKDINHDDPSVREHAIRVVLEFGPSARKATPAVTDQVKRLNDISPQATAIIALAELVPLGPPFVPGAPPDEYTAKAVRALLTVLGSPEAIIRFRAATSLGYVGPHARAAIGEIIRLGLITDRMSWEIRKAVCFAIGRCGRDEQGWPTAAALEELSRGVSDRESKGVRLEALQSVIQLGPPAPPAVTPRLRAALEKRLKDEKDSAVRIWIRVAMMRMDEKQITDKNIAAVAKEIKSNDPEVRHVSVRAIGLMGPAAKAAIPDLIDVLKAPSEPAMVYEVSVALGRMGKLAETAVPALLMHQEDKDNAVKAAVRAAVNDIRNGPAAVNPPARP